MLLIVLFVSDLRLLSIYLLWLGLPVFVLCIHLLFLVILLLIIGLLAIVISLGRILIVAFVILLHVHLTINII